MLFGKKKILLAMYYKLFVFGYVCLSEGGIMKTFLTIVLFCCFLSSGLFAQIIPDNNFRLRMNDILNQPADYEPTIADLNNYTGTVWAHDAGILSIEGARFLVNVTEVSFSGNQINDISSLSGLTNLEEMYLYDNQISDISALSGLVNLKILDLSDNPISDVSALSGLTGLEILRMSDNPISDLSALSGLTNLTYLYLNGNQISDISPLSNLTHLTYLLLAENPISDVSALSDMSYLTNLIITETQISNISVLSGLTNLTDLKLTHNQISDISALSGLANLIAVRLYGNQITDVYPLAENLDFGYEDHLQLQYFNEVDLSNPLSIEALEEQIHVLTERDFAVLFYPDEANIIAPCYPDPGREEFVGFDIGYLSWYGVEQGTIYEAYIGDSADDLHSIGEGSCFGDNRFYINADLEQETEYWWKVKSTTGDEVLWSGMWHFTTGSNIAIEDDTAEIQRVTALNSAYPNPFNPTTNISFEIMTGETGTLSIYNVKGQVIATQSFASGEHNYLWDADKYSSGIYFYKLDTGSYSKINKLVLMK
jgi:hypothetical protein